MLSRPEYWVRIIISNLLIVFFIALVSGVDILTVETADGYRYSLFNSVNLVKIDSLYQTIRGEPLFLLIVAVIALVIFLLNLNWQYKRLWDVGLNGFYVILGLVPFIGWFIMFILMLLPSDSFSDDDEFDI